jgi:PAS domain S-box-containing protein
LTDNSFKKTSTNTQTNEEWNVLSQLQILLQERTERYVVQLGEKKRHLEEHVAALTAMLDCIGDGLILADANGDLALVNEAAQKLVGADMPRKVGQPWPNSNYGLFYDDMVTRIRPEDEPMRQALNGKAVEVVYYGRTSQYPDGRWYRLHATQVCDKAGELLGAVLVFQDVTEIRKAARQREALSALITHDLKNHLGGEGQLIRAMLDGKFGPVTDQQRDILKLIEGDSKRHFRMTNSLMEILRYDMRSSALQFVSIDVNSQVSQFALELTPAVEAANLTMLVECAKALPAVSADVDALRHVIANLVGNAVKHTPAGGQITLATEANEAGVLITVSDTGAGISAAKLARMFVEISPDSIEYRKPEVTSTGLGMYLCAQIIEAHSGKIDCRSEEGKGTTFIVTLPAAVE